MFFARKHRCRNAVIPAKAEALFNSKAGQSIVAVALEQMDSRFRGNDGTLI
jgi:hypothetical protein